MDSFRRSPRISGRDQSPETMPSRWELIYDKVDDDDDDDDDIV